MTWQATIDIENLEWRKATASGNNGCIEVSPLRDGVALRDSKDPDGPMLTYTHHEWSAFLDGAKKGEFDHLTRP